MPDSLLQPPPGRDMPTINSTSLQAVGLRGWWPVFGQGAAGFWRSPTVTGVGLSLSNVTRSNDPVLGPVFSFNASAGGISTTGAVPETAAWTIAAWLRPTSTSGNVLIAGHVNSLSSASTWSTILGMRAGILDGYFFNGSARHTTGTTTLSTNTLYHVVFTADTAANLYALYINGVVDTASSPSTTTAPSAAVNQFGVGCTTGSQAGNDFTTRYSGTLGDVRRYNRALSAGEVWQLWAAETRWALYGPERAIRRPISAAVETAAALDAGVRAAMRAPNFVDAVLRFPFRATAAMDAGLRLGVGIGAKLDAALRFQLVGRPSVDAPLRVKLQVQQRLDSTLRMNLQAAGSGLPPSGLAQQFVGY